VDKWPLIHEYRRMVSSGEAREIRCPDCGFELVPVVASDGDPALRCFSCMTVFNIGSGVYDQIKKVVEND